MVGPKKKNYESSFSGKLEAQDLSSGFSFSLEFLDSNIHPKSPVQIVESWNVGYVHTHSCLFLIYSIKVYKYLSTDTLGFEGNGGVFL